MNSNLVITAQGPDSLNVFNHLTQNLTNLGANILSTKMLSVGSEFAVVLHIEGSWSAIAKIEAQIPSLEQKLGISASCRRPEPEKNRKKIIGYLVHAVTLDREGILSDLTQFFVTHEIAISDINAHTYTANSGAKMSNIAINLQIPLDMHIPSLREKFNLYCDALNLDAGFEPTRD